MKYLFLTLNEIIAILRFLPLRLDGKCFRINHVTPFNTIRYTPSSSCKSSSRICEQRVAQKGIEKEKGKTEYRVFVEPLSLIPAIQQFIFMRMIFMKREGMASLLYNGCL